MEKKFKCLEPEYVARFECDGRKCNAKCCRGWQVDIDRKTHEKYKQLTEQNMRRKILDSLYWNESTHTYRMKLDRVSCPLLRDDLLCDIQKHYGSEYLSNTCSEFPRRTFVVDEFAERSLSMTCPVAADLALLDRQPLKFRYVELKTTRAACFFYRSAVEMPARKFLPTLQKISIDVLQDRRLSMNNRLTALGFMMSELDSMLLNGKEAQLELVPTVYRSDEYFQLLATRSKSLEFSTPEYVMFMVELMKRLMAEAIVYYSDEQRIFTQYPIEAFQLETPFDTWDEVVALYQKNIAAYKKFVLEPFGHIVENYIVHSFFAGLYPCHVPITLMNNYFLFLALIKVFEFGLISMAAVLREDFKPDDLLEFIERFANRLDHASLFTQLTLDFITDRVREPLALMSALLDNQS